MYGKKGSKDKVGMMMAVMMGKKPASAKKAKPQAMKSYAKRMTKTKKM